MPIRLQDLLDEFVPALDRGLRQGLPLGTPPNQVWLREARTRRGDSPHRPEVSPVEELLAPPPSSAPEVAPEVTAEVPVEVPPEVAPQPAPAPPPLPKAEVVRDAQEEILIGFESRPAKVSPPPPVAVEQKFSWIAVEPAPAPPEPAPPPRKVQRITITEPEPELPSEGPNSPRGPAPPEEKLLEVIGAAHTAGAPFDMLVTWFQSSPRELRKVLDRLQEEGKLVAEGERYRLPDLE